MAGEGDLIAIRMRLLGGKEAAAEADAVTASIRETGVAAEQTSAKTATSSKAAAAESAAATKAIKRNAESMKALGRGMTKYITAPLLAIGGASVYMAAKFERSMLKLHTQAGVAKGELAGLKDSFFEVAKATGFSPEEISAAGYRLAGAGMRGQELKEATHRSALLAMVGDANPEETAKTLSQVWFTNIKGGKDFNRVISEINATVGAGDLRLPQLVDALGTGVVASAKQAGLSMQDVNGALAVFGDETNNVSGWSAQLATALHFITNPTEKAQGALKELGLSSTDLSEDLHKPHGLATALRDLKTRLQDLPGGEEGVQANKIIGDILPGGRGRVLLVLINQLDRLEQKMQQIKGTAGEFGQSIKETEDQPMIRMEKAWSAIQVDMVELGEALIPVVIPALETAGNVVSDVAGFFNEMDPSLKGVVGELLALAAAIGPLILLGGKLEKVWLGAKAAMTMGSITQTGTKGLGGRLGVAGAGVGLSMIGGNMLGGELGNIVSGVGSGAALGFSVGGPWGAGIGAAAGGLMTILPGLFASTPKISKMRRETEHLTDAMHGYKSSIAGLDHAEDRAKNAAQRHAKTVRNLRAAHHNLIDVLAHYGPNSHKATEAQLRLARAERQATKAARAESRAHQLVGFRLKEFRIQSLHAVASIKQLIPNQKRRIGAMREEVNQGRTGIAFLNELEKLEGRVAKEKQHLTGVYAEAEAKAGKPWAKRLQGLNTLQARYGANGKVLVTRLQEQKTKLSELTATGGRLSPMFGELKEEIRETTQELNHFVEATEGLAPARRESPATQGEHGHQAPGSHPAPTGKNGRKETMYTGNGRAAAYLSRPVTTGKAGASASSAGGRPLEIRVPVMLDGRQVGEAGAKVTQDDEARL